MGGGYYMVWWLDFGVVSINMIALGFELLKVRAGCPEEAERVWELLTPEILELMIQCQSNVKQPNKNKVILIFV